jgi:hypothetical protein
MIFCFAIGFCTETSVASTTGSTTVTEKQEEVVAIFSGGGRVQTAPFTVTRRWKMEWICYKDSSPSFYIYKADGPHDSYDDSCGGAQSGISYYYKMGEFYIYVGASGSWTIKITYQ